MTSQELIESGTLELYCLGMSSSEEQRLIEQQTEGNKLLESYIIELETKIRAYFNNNAVAPPEDMREIIALRTGATAVSKPKHIFKTQKEKEDTVENKYLDIEVDDTHIKVHKYWRPAFIAVFILSKIFLIAGLYFYFKSASLNDELERLKTNTYTVPKQAP